MSDTRTRAFWITGHEQGELRDDELPPCRVGEIEVATRYSGISRGTESLVFGGRVPESEYQRMRAPCQQGDFPWPVKYGYSAVGKVVGGEPDWQGRRVFCLYPHQDRFVIPVDLATPLPEDVPDERAILAANMETAVNALWDAGPRVGDRIAVVGAGVVGCLIAWLSARIMACRVQLLDIDRDRAEVAESLGLTFQLAEGLTRGDSTSETCSDNDLVFHTSASSAGLQTSLALAGQEATVVELSWYGDARVAVPLGETFHSRRLTIQSSQVGAVAPARRSRWSFARRRALAVELLRHGELDALIDGESDFEELPSTLARLSRPDSRALCHRVRYRSRIS